MKQTRCYTKTNILQAIGLMMAFLSIIFLLAPFTAIYPITFGGVALLGFSFYYVFLPLLFIVGCVLTVKGKLGHILGWQFYVGSFLALIGAGLIFALITKNNMDVTRFSDFSSVYKDYYEEGKFIQNMECGAGIFYVFLFKLLDGINAALSVTVSISLLVIGILLAFFRLIAKLIGLISRKITHAKAKRASQKQLEEAKEELRKALEEKNKSGPKEYSDPFGNEPVRIPLREEKEEVVPEKPLPSRFEANHEHPKSEIEIPAEIPFNIPKATNWNRNELSLSGIRAATFTFGDEEETAPAQKPFPEPIPEPIPQPIILEDKHEIIESPAIPEPTLTIEEEKEEQMFLGETNMTLNQQENFTNEEQIDSLLDSDEHEDNSYYPEDNFISEVPLVEEKPQPQVTQQAPVSPTDSLSDEEKGLMALHQPKAKPLPAYEFPSLDLLQTYENDQDTDQINADCQSNVNRINAVFQNLGVGAHVVDYTIGPSVTRYNIQTDLDVSVSSIGRYMTDISVRLGGQAVRFEEIVRGKDTSGLEIPNAVSTIVSLKEMIAGMSPDPKDNMMVPFGISISGDCVCSDLSKFPHMMVAGTTGSGKSIFMHGLIMSLIMRNRPEDCKIVLVDPKRVEMTKYKDLPHLLCPIIKEPSEAKVCMDKLIEEMDRRYKLFEFACCRDIRSFNSGYATKNNVEKLPFIVVFIDEYADLVDTCKNIGEPVVRLAQKARAAGIHLVIATQRPSVQVITGVIKANIPVRVALSMSSSIDSQTIIGQGGAEDLVGHGDMLIDCSLIARVGFTRAQGCLVLDEEIERVVDFIKSQGLGTMYNENFLDLVDHEEEARIAEANAPVVDTAAMKAQSNQEFYENVKKVVMEQEYTSISKIQRMFNVGFPRAGKLFQQLQQDGIVAISQDASTNSKGCKVLVHSSPSDDVNDVKLGSDN